MGCTSCSPLFGQSQRCPKSRHCLLVCLSQTTLFSCVQSMLDSSRLHISVFCLRQHVKTGTKGNQILTELAISCSAEEVLVFSVHPSPNQVFLQRGRSTLGGACVPRVCAVTEHIIPSVWQSLCDNTGRGSALLLPLWEPGSYSLC